MSDIPVIDTDGTRPEAEMPEPAFGVHVVMMPDGNFGIQVTGQPNLGEMIMLLARALESVKVRMVVETMQAIQSEQKIVTPTTGGALPSGPLHV